jgi:hypothetical protein
MENLWILILLSEIEINDERIIKLLYSVCQELISNSEVDLQ